MAAMLAAACLVVAPALGQDRGTDSYNTHSDPAGSRDQGYSPGGDSGDGSRDPGDSAPDPTPPDGGGSTQSGGSDGSLGQNTGNPGIGQGGDTVDVPLPPAPGGAVIAGAGGGFDGNPPGGTVVVLDDRETDALINSGWGASAGSAASTAAPAATAPSERVDLLVDLAVQQGYAPQVGMVQATYGTPQENGLAEIMRQIAALETAPPLSQAQRQALNAAVRAAEARVSQRQAVLAQARAINQGVAEAEAAMTEAARELAEARGALTAADAQAERERQERLQALRAQLRAMIRSLTNAGETNESWLLINLDANGDGAVDRRDLR
jgi:hypothetical protein